MFFYLGLQAPKIKLTTAFAQDPSIAGACVQVDLADDELIIMQHTALGPGGGSTSGPAPRQHDSWRSNLHFAFWLGSWRRGDLQVPGLESCGERA